jgi:GntR family transcriptional regulator
MNALAEPEVVIVGGQPVQQQLATQIRQQIRLGILRPGEELPTVRAVAVALAIRPPAVEAAYRQLENEGFLISGESCGPLVADPSKEAKNTDLESSCCEFMSRVAAQGHSLTEVVRILHECLERGQHHGEPR